jgi:hypothetical protein
MNRLTDDYGKDFEIIVEDDWVRIQALPGSVITVDVILSMLKQLYSLEAYRSEKTAGLWDFRGCKSDLGHGKIEKIIQYIDIKYDPGWSHTVTAIVADQDLIYGLSRMYEIMTDHIPTKVNIFRDMDEAQNWLREHLK